MSQTVRVGAAPIPWTIRGIFSHHVPEIAEHFQHYVLTTKGQTIGSVSGFASGGVAVGSNFRTVTIQSARSESNIGPIVRTVGKNCQREPSIVQMLEPEIQPSRPSIRMVAIGGSPCQTEALSVSNLLASENTCLFHVRRILVVCAYRRVLVEWGRDVWSRNLLEQLLKLVGELNDKAGSDTPRDGFRQLLDASVTSLGTVRDYVDVCLNTTGPQYNRALQDLVNHAGQLMGFEVEFGRYAGVANDVGHDGLWRADDFSIAIEVETTDAYSIMTSTLLGYHKSAY